MKREMFRGYNTYRKKWTPVSQWAGRSFLLKNLFIIEPLPERPMKLVMQYKHLFITMISTLNFDFWRLYKINPEGHSATIPNRGIAPNTINAHILQGGCCQWKSIS